MKRITTTFCLLLAAICSMAQSDLEVGGWKNHFSYRNGLDLQEWDNKMYVVTANALYTLDLADGIFHSINVMNGLSDVGLSRLFLDEPTSTFLVCYSNSNLDLYNNGKVCNIPDLKDKQMPGDKSVYNACISSPYAYLACGFGILVLDLKKQLVRETWNFQLQNQIVPVYDVCLLGDTIFAATSQGIYVNSLSNRRIAQFSTWEKMADTTLPSLFVVKHMDSYRNSVYAFEEDTWQLYIAEYRHLRYERDISCHCLFDISMFRSYNASRFRIRVES